MKISLFAIVLAIAAVSTPALAQSSRPYAAPNASDQQRRQSTDEGLRVAQASGGAANAASPSGQLEEILVTAEKRESTVQNTPISITAVSGAELQERGINNLNAIAQSVPGLSMRSNGPGQTIFQMRGMSSSGGNTATVGFYLDDVPLSAPAQTSVGKVVADPNLYDINRVEVLRGPQGTLYGSGSMGGTIKIITNAPNPAAFDASAELIPSHTDGGGFNHGENAMVNIPFAGNTAALRVVGSHSYTSGWIDRIVIADGQFPLETNNSTQRGNILAAPIGADYRDVNSTELTAVRASVLWMPTDRMTFTPTYVYQQIYQPGLSVIDTNPGTNAHYQPFDVPESYSDYFNLASLAFRYQFDRFDLNSTTSHYARQVFSHQDGSEGWQWALGLPSYYTSAGGLGPLNPTPLENDRSKQFSEEIRLTSSGSGPFKWLIGYYYADFTSYFNGFFTAPGAIPLFGLSNLYTTITPTTAIQQSLFGEMSYQLSPQLRATVGARRYSFKEGLNSSSSGALSATGSDVMTSDSASARNQGLNPKFDLSYEPSGNLLLYTTIAKGFRPGGANLPIPVSGPSSCEPALQHVYGTTDYVPAPFTYAPDWVWNYELGEKMKALDNRLTVNSAVYFEHWGAIQQFIPLSCGFQFTGNADSAHVYGAEFEIQALVAPGLVLSVNGGYTHATITSSNTFGVGSEPGSRIQNVPERTSTQSLAYRRGIADGLAMTARIENNYVGARTDATFGINQLPSYDLTSVRAGVEGRHWSAVLFAANVFNKRVLASNMPLANFDLPMYNRAMLSQPLTIGLDLSFRFHGSP